jgi:hypothetical protein
MVRPLLSAVAEAAAEQMKKDEIDPMTASRELIQEKMRNPLGDGDSGSKIASKDESLEESRPTPDRGES